MVDIVIFGAGQFAETIAEYIRKDTTDNVVAYTVDREYCDKPEFNGLPLIPWEDLESYYSTEQVLILGPISYRDANQFRKNRYIEGKERGYSFYTFIHPNAYNYAKKIGENVIVLEGNTLQPFVEIGNNCILWSHNHIGHHTKIKDHVFLCGKVGIGGNCQIMDGVFLSGYSSCIDNITIGEWSFLTFGSIASSNIEENSVVIKEKCRVIKNVARRFLKRLMG